VTETTSGSSITTAFIGLGGNIGDAPAAMADAIARIDALDYATRLDVSSLYRSAPVGYTDQADFYNAVASFACDCEAITLLDALLKIESDLGRVRDGPRFGPRVVDLDLLIFGEARIDTRRLTVPHPRVHQRRFALEPLVEIAPLLSIPGLDDAATLLDDLMDQAVERIDPKVSPEHLLSSVREWPAYAV